MWTFWHLPQLALLPLTQNSIIRDIISPLRAIQGRWRPSWDLENCQMWNTTRDEIPSRYSSKIHGPWLGSEIRKANALSFMISCWLGVTCLIWVGHFARASSQHAHTGEMLILELLFSKMSSFWLGVILCTTAVSSLCPNHTFSTVKESKETCTTLHGVSLKFIKLSTF